MKKELIGLIGVIIAVILIIVAACSNNIKPQPQPSAAAAASFSLPSLAPSSPILSYAPEVTYTVKTDYSQLKPYKPIDEIYTRLSDDFMPELVPSDNYGPLVPYVGAALYTDYGYEGATYEGLVTETGIIVTDAVYTDIYMIGDEHAFYVLEKQIDDSGEDYLDMGNYLYTLCAADGSWVSPSDYKYICQLDKVELLCRDAEKNDIDVYDKSGHLLYNINSLDYYSNLPVLVKSGWFGFEYGEGYFSVTLNNGIAAFIEEETGKNIETAFSDATRFVGGYAAVEQNGLWGYIDKDFNLFIDPTYTNADNFYNGKAIVGLPDGNDAVIDLANNLLLKAPEIYYDYDLIVTNDGDYLDKKDGRQLYDDQLQKVAGNLRYIDYCSDGWYLSSSYDSSESFLYHNGKLHSFPVKSNYFSICGNMVILGLYENMDLPGAETIDSAVFTLDGKPVIPLLKNTKIGFQSDENSELKYVFVYDRSKNTYKTFDKRFNRLFSGSGDIYYSAVNGKPAFVNNDAAADFFRVFDESGEEMLSGPGNIGLSGSALFRVSSDRFFAYMDTSGKYVFRISLLDSIPD